MKASIFAILAAATGRLSRHTVDGLSSSIDSTSAQRRLVGPNASPAKKHDVLNDVVYALEVMQNTYFDMFAGTWPEAIDWTAAVMGTHISATLSSIVSAFQTISYNQCATLLSWQNIIDRYYAHTSFFYFGENAFGLRNQAYDDMLWVVLGWIENIKFAEMYSHKLWDGPQSQAGLWPSDEWHGLQFSPMAAHRARIFYDLAAQGWDESLCGGGMTWNPYLTPYKNAITNELFTSASIAMYLYYPGDNNSSPYFTASRGEKWQGIGKPHDSQHLDNAVRSYRWLKDSNMRSKSSGLYQDGFHVSGWRRYHNGTVDPGTGECDDLDRMVYTYNQGVVLSASRGLWLATGTKKYLDDGHALVENVIRATGWPNAGRRWHGLGRGGVLEEYCDHRGQCSQDGQTFKGIFFLHLAEFCRTLWPHEEDFMSTHVESDHDKATYEYHLSRCRAYENWIEHNAKAALSTRDQDGLFGMWWTFEARDENYLSSISKATMLPEDTIDQRNPSMGVNIPSLRARGDFNDRGRGRTVETQAGGLSVLRAHWQWKSAFS